MIFSYISGIPEFKDLYISCSDAEKLCGANANASIGAARRATEFIVKKLYGTTVSSDIYDMSLYDMVSDPAFIRTVNNQNLLNSINYIRKSGNKAVHAGAMTKSDAINVLKSLNYITGEIAVILGVIDNYPQFDEEKIGNDKSELEIQISKKFLKTIGMPKKQDTSPQLKEMVDVHVDPRFSKEKIDSAANSKAAFAEAIECLKQRFPECEVRADKTRGTATVVSAAGTEVCVSVKSGCPPLGNTDAILPGIDLILYVPRFDVESPAIGQLRVFTKQEFLRMWNDLGLIRYKVSNNASKRYHELYGPDFKIDIKKHADVISVQSFENSGKKRPMVYNRCNEKPLFATAGLTIIDSMLSRQIAC